jgi:penicillin amidase
MPITEFELLAVLRGQRVPSDIGLGQTEFDTARDAFLAERAHIGNSELPSPVGGKVEILRDGAGIPHIYADSSVDLHFGLGVAMAQDRLWQMDRLRRRALGRQAEIMGPAYAASDLAHLTVGINLMAAREPALMDGDTYQVVAAMAAGINRQIAAFGDKLPIEFALLDYRPEPFTVGCIVAIARGLWWSLNGRIDRIAAAEASRFMPTPELRELYLTPEASEHTVLGSGGNVQAAGTDDATGSNNWAVTASRTGTGHAVMAGDPHQPFWVPSSWYEFALHGPQDNAAGCGHPGVPGLWWGSNGRIAWSLTNNAASTRDLYREQVDPADPTRYRDGDVWRHFTERQVTIKVRGEADRAHTIRSTVRGPLVNHMVPALDPDDTTPLSLRWVGAEHIDDMRALVSLGRAQDWNGFRTALRDWSVAVFNWIYADAGGNVGYQMAGRIPVRGRVHHGYRDAAELADRWTGPIPFEALPHAYNPSGGFVASANQRIVGADYAYPVYGAYSQGHRGVRIDAVFAAHPKAGPAETVALQNDIHSTRAARLAPAIVALLRDAGGDAGEVATILAGWDFRYTTDSVAALLFETLMAHWQRRVLAEHIPERLIDLTQQQTGIAATLLEQPEMAYFPGGTSAALQQTAGEAIAALTTRLGSDRAAWRWGNVHLAHWRHPVSGPASAGALDIGPLPVDGGSHTVRNTGGEAPPHGAGSGAEYRIVVDFAAPDSFRAVQNIGNSGVPGSPHYRDQFVPWIQGEYHVVHLARSAVEAECRSKVTLLPG